MKIVVVGPAHPLRGGIAQFNERLSSEFQKLGHQVVLFSFSRQYPDILFPGKTQFDSGAAPKGLDIRTVIDSINPFNWLKVARQINKEQPDLIVVRYWLPFMGPCLGSILRLVRSNNESSSWPKVVAITDNVIPHEHRPGDRIFTQYFVNSCDGFVAMSGKVMDEISAFDSQKPRLLIHHPIYDQFGEPIDKTMARKQLGLNTKGKVIAFFGLVRHYKGLDLLIRAMADDRLRDMRLFIAGEAYGETETYLKLINELGLQERISWRNEFIPAEVVPAVFCAADVVVQPYRTASQSGVTQIAYHFARPMIVTNVGGLPEMVTHGQGALVCEPRAEAIAEALDQFYSENREAEFSEMVKREAQRFSWQAMAEGIISLS